MNIGNPSPQEIFDSYSQIPNTPQGKQMLTNLVQAFKNSGDMRGSIATSILNSYNSQQPPAPPPPQGQVADHVVAQAQPHPDFMGIGAPGLDLTAPPGMATGGLVAFAQGGPVRGFWGGGETDLSGEYNPFMEGMPDVPDAPDISGAVNDYYSAPPAPPPATSNPGDVGNDVVSKISRMQELYGTPPDIAAELISKHEHDQAKREKFNAFENIAAALGGYLSAYGPGQHRAGAGIAAMLGQMGQHDKEAREDSNYMDALRMKAAMQPYDFHSKMVDAVLGIEAKERAERDKLAHDITIERLRNQGDINVANVYGGNKIRAAEITAFNKPPTGQITPAVVANIRTDVIKALVSDPANVHKIGTPEFNKMVDDMTEQALKDPGASGGAPRSLPQVQYTPPSR